MRTRIFFITVVLSILLMLGATGGQAQSTDPEVTPQDLINLMNGLRVQNGYGALIVDPILMRTAQETAEIMALNQMSGHIGNVRERVADAGYGAGDIPWATENFATGPTTIERIQQVWADPDHMRPAVNPDYQHIGAGVAEYNGKVYYIVHAAYTSNGVYQPGATTSTNITGGADGVVVNPTEAVSQIIYPVETVTPQADGIVTHTVRQGQSLWAIAIAYGTKIDAIVAANNLLPDNPIIYQGQTLIIPITPQPGANVVTEIQETPTTAVGITLVPDSSTPMSSPSAANLPTKRATRTPELTTATATVVPSNTPRAPGNGAPLQMDRIIQIGLIAAVLFGLGLILLGTIDRGSK